MIGPVLFGKKTSEQWCEFVRVTGLHSDKLQRRADEIQLEALIASCKVSRYLNIVTQTSVLPSIRAASA